MSFKLLWIFCLIIVGGVLTLSFLNQRVSHIDTHISKLSDNTPTVSFDNIEMIIRKVYVWCSSAMVQIMC